MDSYAGVGPRLRASLCIARSCNCFQPDPDHAQCPTGLGFLPSGIISSRISFLILLNIVLLILGMFIDGAPAILILSPLLMPIAQQFGIDPVHLGIIMVCNLAVGLASPPFGLNLFVASSTNGAPIIEISRKSCPLSLHFLVALILITFVPSISLCLV